MTEAAPTDRVRHQPDRHFEDPLTLVDRDDIAYEMRRDMLQTWLSRVAEGDAARGPRAADRAHDSMIRTAPDADAMIAA